MWRNIENGEGFCGALVNDFARVRSCCGSVSQPFTHHFGRDCRQISNRNGLTGCCEASMGRNSLSSA